MSKTTLIYGDFAPGSAKNAAFSGSNYDSSSNLTELRNDHDQVNIATMEKNQWILDGAYSFRDGKLTPFWSDVISDTNCVLSPYPTITINFTKQYSSVGITFVFEEMPGCYAADLNVKWYRGSSLLADTDFYPTDSNAFCQQHVELYNKIVVTFRKTGVPQQRIRLKQIIFGAIRKYGMSEIRSARITNQMNHISAEVPVSTLDWELDSIEDANYMFQFKQPVEVWNDENMVGVYYVSESRRTSQSLYNIRCQDAFGLLDDDTFPGGVYSGYSAKQLFSEIIGSDYTIDTDSVSDALLTGILLEMTKRAALQQVLFGWGVCAATDGDGTIRVFNLDSRAKEIGPGQVYTGVSVETSTLITAVVVTAHNYQEDPNGAIEINGKKYTDAQTTYTIKNPDVTETTKANVLKVEAANFVNSTNVRQVAQRIYDYYMRRVTAKVKLVWRGELLGDCVTVPDAWGGTHTGNIARMNITLSNTVAASTEVIT